LLGNWEKIRAWIAASESPTFLSARNKNVQMALSLMRTQHKIPSLTVSDLNLLAVNGNLLGGSPNPVVAGAKGRIDGEFLDVFALTAIV
jgi:hypothetical protein